MEDLLGYTGTFFSVFFFFFFFNFFSVERRFDQTFAGVSATAWPIVQLVILDESLHNRHHEVFADNWFTGVEIVVECAAVGVGYTGTVKIRKTKIVF